MSDDPFRELLPPGSWLTAPGGTHELHYAPSSMTLEEAFMTLYLVGWKQEHYLWFYRYRFMLPWHHSRVCLYYDVSPTHDLPAKLWTEGIRLAFCTYYANHGVGYDPSKSTDTTFPPSLPSAVAIVFDALQEARRTMSPELAPYDEVVSSSDSVNTSSPAAMELGHSYDDGEDQGQDLGYIAEQADGYSSETMRESSPEDEDDEDGATTVNGEDETRSTAGHGLVKSISAVTDTTPPSVIIVKLLYSRRRLSSPPSPVAATSSTVRRGDYQILPPLPPLPPPPPPLPSASTSASASPDQETEFTSFRAEDFNDDDDHDDSSDSDYRPEEGDDDSSSDSSFLPESDDDDDDDSSDDRNNENNENADPERASLQQDIDAAKGTVLVHKKQLALYARRYDKHGGDAYDPDGAHGLRLAGNLRAATRKLEEKCRCLEAYLRVHGGYEEDGGDGEKAGEGGDEEVEEERSEDDVPTAEPDITGEGEDIRKTGKEKKGGDDHDGRWDSPVGSMERITAVMEDEALRERRRSEAAAILSQQAEQRRRQQIAQQLADLARNFDQGMAAITKLKESISQTKEKIQLEVEGYELCLGDREARKVRIESLIELKKLECSELHKAVLWGRRIGNDIDVLKREEQEQVGSSQPPPQPTPPPPSLKRNFAEHVAGTTPSPLTHRQVPPTRATQKYRQRRTPMRPQSPEPAVLPPPKKLRISFLCSPSSSSPSDPRVEGEHPSPVTFDATTTDQIVVPNQQGRTDGQDQS